MRKFPDPPTHQFACARIPLKPAWGNQETVHYKVGFFWGGQHVEQ